MHRYSSNMHHRILLLGSLLGLLVDAVGCARNDEPRSGGTAGVQQLLRLRNLALAYLEAEQHDPAVEALDQLARLLPDEPMVHANRGLIALREGRIEDAKAHLEEAARLAPDHPDIAWLRALGAVYDADDQTARTVLEHAVEKNPDHRRARWALVELLRRDRRPESRDTALTHLQILLDQVPQNVIVRLALARQLLERGEGNAASGHLSALDQQQVAGSEQARQLLADARQHINDDDLDTARSLVIALDNVLKPSRAWQTSLAEVRGPPVTVADPVWEFVAERIQEPSIAPRAIEVGYRDIADTVGLDGLRAQRAALMPGGQITDRSIATVAGDEIAFYARGADGRYSPVRRLPRPETSSPPTRLLVADWNNDRGLDLICGFADGSVYLWLRGADDQWHRADPLLEALDPPAACRLLLAWDADHDGDLDLLVGRQGIAPAVVRNNGDPGAPGVTEIAAELGIARGGVSSLVDAAIADLDEDGDMDLVAVGADGAMIRYDNQRSGRFDVGHTSALPANAARVAAGDFDNDGWFDLAVLTTDGAVVVVANQQGLAFDLRSVAAVGPMESGAAAIKVLDFDNDGYLDLLVLASGQPHLLRNEGALVFGAAQEVLPPVGDVRDLDVADHDGDGDLDLFVTFENGRLALWDNEGANGHDWQQVRLEAIVEGGQRNNAYGVGGFIELRAGRAYQKRLVRGAVTHFGLNAFGPADAIRVVWPNGVPENILQPEPNQLIVEEQSLKGSCPFLLAFNGQRLEFVTDLLWRSPLGMKINAQTVAPVVTTKDYVKIKAAQLQSRGGRYEAVITAALWETIYIDDVELWAVDHPADLEIFVDERFVAPDPPRFQIEVVDTLRAPIRAVDDRGRDVLEMIERRDGRRLGGFAKGRYQGVARPHHVELDLGPWSEPQTVRLIASGWTMPTDTSINVAMAQGAHARPEPLSVWVADGAGGWVEAISNAGFPAGKLKTIVLDLSGRFPSSDHRLQLRTNLEIYWDRIAFALGDRAFEARPVVLETRRADLEYLGFPDMVRADALAPELPDYTRPKQAPQWRDLEGYYTRYGDVRELLADIDDRYVIMNAGDAIRLSFEDIPPLPTGWVRDFILFSDGWVKDGDLNTVASQTVAPLPYHGLRGYPPDPRDAPAVVGADHPDRLHYHTRYVTSSPFWGRWHPQPWRRSPSDRVPEAATAFDGE